MSPSLLRSSSSSNHYNHLLNLFYKARELGRPLSVSILKACTDISMCERVHSLALKNGCVDSDVYLRNSFINLYMKHGRIATARHMFDTSPHLDTASWNTMIVGYVKSHRLEDAQKLFQQMPSKNCISFTTMIMGFAQNGCPNEALVNFQEMHASGVNPNEVTLACVISACSQLRLIQPGRMVHALAMKNGLKAFLLVSTNLVHLYSVCSSVSDAESIFFRMPEKNIVTWNVMLNGYSKCGLLDLAEDLFQRMPFRDLVSWATMVDGFIKSDKLGEALITYREMLRVGLRPNEVTVVDLVSACGRCFAFQEGQQFHAMIIKVRLDCFVFMQSAIIHFYSLCSEFDLANLQFDLSDKDHVSNWNTMLGGYVRHGMVSSARQIFEQMPNKDVISWSTLITGYVQNGHFYSALELFREMQSKGFEPNEITMVSVVSALANSGTLDQGDWIYNYITENLIPLSDNLSAGLIDMYAKCGSISRALSLFNQVKERVTSISPWNAIICGLAMHGHADMSLKIFFELERMKNKQRIKPNSITFIGVLSACCHSGLVENGRWYFEQMKCVYDIEPNVKHYGCMVDLLGRAGHLKEAERLIEGMPMEADVVIWGTMLAACRTHGVVDVGERAAENLARLEPRHGAGKVLLSNIYAGMAMWDDMSMVRKEMYSGRLKKLPGCSGFVGGDKFGFVSERVM
ncbi:Pentatricopeptide repeat-containing protein [Acorus gramineus]|uniref:Pentatricopeptide repeat-containing protein n=1 Tax=Acorus gramineus TaxID=55184 RepID=A0AAV9B202_ACOGR|nr:Pentatricopeptide repeat-containing protein [Acorus gramineus]